jgi:hypothetical protein
MANQIIFECVGIKESFLLNEADTCRKYVGPRLVQAGWDDEPHSFTGQQNFTDGRIFVVGDSMRPISLI